MSVQSSSPPEVDRTVILIGATGNGQSTLRNVLVGCHPDKNVFWENSDGVMRTPVRSTEEVTVDVSLGEETCKLRLVDTVGIGDGKLPRKEVLLSLAEVCHSTGGIHQLFFVSKHRFSEEDKDAWRVVQEVLFDKDVVDYTTIVRTHINPGDLENPEMIRADLEALCRGGDEMATVFKRLISAGRVLNICNPNDPAGVDGWFKIREDSRERLMRHLVDKCDKLFKPTNLDRVNERVGAEIDALESKEREIRERREREIRERRALENQERKTRESKELKAEIRGSKEAVSRQSTKEAVTEHKGPAASGIDVKGASSPKILPEKTFSYSQMVGTTCLPDYKSCSLPTRLKKLAISVSEDVLCLGLVDGSFLKAVCEASLAMEIEEVTFEQGLVNIAGSNIHCLAVAILPKTKGEKPYSSKQLHELENKFASCMAQALEIDIEQICVNLIQF